jgi:hypothetical protein
LLFFVWILDSFLNSYGISKMHFDIDYFSIIFMKITGWDPTMPVRFFNPKLLADNNLY